MIIDHEAYYVSVANGDADLMIAGPFDERADALTILPTAKALAIGLDPRARSYGFGIVCVVDPGDLPPGALNTHLGLQDDPRGSFQRLRQARDTLLRTDLENDVA